VKLSVTDTGPGIPRDQQGLVFEPFTQVDSTARRPHPGTGLGLAISRKLVDALGGKIGLESAIGSGSTFWFTLPAELAEAHRGATPELREAASSYSKLRVLVAEDNKVNRLIAVRCLLALGIRADTAENGEQAIAAASSTAYDLILMDVQMPGIDGLQATRAIRVCSRGNPFIAALTAHVLPEHRAECLAVGMNDFLSKPLEMDALREILTRIGPARAKAHAV
jgi:CheY-like chemotaxis protein